MDQKRAIIESPYSGDIQANVEYALACMQDSLSRNEAPFLPHLLYTRFPEDTSGNYAGHKSDDGDFYRRLYGINAGYLWGKNADLVAFYLDLGESEGMNKAKTFYSKHGVPIEYRSLRSLTTKLVAISGKMAAGKTTLQNALIESCCKLRVARVSIAWPLKKVAADLCGMSLEEDRKDRALLIDLGNVVRDRETDRLVNMAVHKAKQLAKYHDIVIIDDLRFQNEAPILRAAGFKLVRCNVSSEVQKTRIRAKYSKTWEQHFDKLCSRSETDLDDYPGWDVVFEGCQTPTEMASVVLSSF